MVRESLALVGILAATLASAAEAAPAKPSSDPAEIALLIKQLGSEEFTVREEATETLTKIGLPAFTALEAAATNPDREVRFRAVRILGTIRELDLQRRLEAFLSGKDDQGEYALPGWSRFKKTYGDDSQSRQMFVEMQRADGELLRALEDGPKPAAEVLERRTLQLQQAAQVGVQQLSLGQIAGMLFVATEPDVTPATQTMLQIFNYCNHQSIREAIDGSAKKPIPRKMVGTLITRSEDWAAYQAMILAYNHKLPEGLVPALKILNGQVNRAAHMSQYALLTVARNGDASHLPLVEKLLEDKSVVTRMQENNKVWDVQVRDAALATAIMLTKQELKIYFTGRPEQTVTDPQQIFFNPRLIGFQNEADRQAVAKKWAEWRAANPPKSPAAPDAKPAEKPADKPAP
ncbi:MAG: HEAT repeat domain-containing protein [Pirellulaceae bacterium]|nr:HEAT repeat domain-containing protein [Pirellulaceae bacterium]